MPPLSKACPWRAVRPAEMAGQAQRSRRPSYQIGWGDSHRVVTASGCIGILKWDAKCEKRLPADGGGERDECLTGITKGGGCNCALRRGRASKAEEINFSCLNLLKATISSTKIARLLTTVVCLCLATNIPLKMDVRLKLIY